MNETVDRHEDSEDVAELLAAAAPRHSCLPGWVWTSYRGPHSRHPYSVGIGTLLVSFSEISYFSRSLFRGSLLFSSMPGSFPRLSNGFHSTFVDF